MALLPAYAGQRAGPKVLACDIDRPWPLGATREFICPDCGHIAEVAGGRDCGFITVVQTILCRDCWELYDARANERPQDVVGAEGIRGRLTGIRCPNSPDHKFVRWRHSWPCPKCGGRMVKGRPGLCWD
jgi:Zn finger protein HypA/HybF involved in hydrogenase expression